MKNQQPNILLITCDQLRSDYVGCYGADFMETPNIDALAQEGCIYENAYSPNPVCIPARHNLLTGLTARHHGFDDNYFGPESKAMPYYLPTFPQILSDYGYETIAIGKMHFKPERRMNGFDYFLNMNELPPTRESDDYAMYLKEQGYGHLGALHGVRTCLYMQPQRSLVPAKHHGSTWVADRVIDYLDETRGRMPFLMWAGFIHPHPPLDVPDEYADMYKGKIPAPVRSATPLCELAKENIPLACQYDDEVLTRTRELYAASISFVDYNIGRIVQKLKELKLYDNTLILFTSDHGEMLGDLGTYQKFLPYDASSKIPFIIRYPQKIASGSTDSRFVDLNDILPTFLDAGGAPYPADYDLPGESVFVRNGVKNRNLQYAEHQKGSRRWCMIRNKHYKYVYHYGDKEQLFDMENDPQETTNLLWECDNQQILAVRDELKETLLAYEKRYGLKDCIDNGTFASRPPFEPELYYECNPPYFVDMLVKEEEKMSMCDYAEEILKAIEKEPSVKLNQNHTYEILNYLGFSDDYIKNLMNRAKAQGNFQEN